MKSPIKSLLLLAISCGVAGAPLSKAAEKPAMERRVTVTYVSPEKFTDFTSSGFGAATDKDLRYLTELFTDHLEKLAKQYLAPDERLEVTFKDIDFAGRYEPEHGPRTEDVRIYRDITYPRMSLSFRLLGPDGQVRAEGERTLKDMSYNMNILPPTGDNEFRYDKELLNDWMRREFKKKKP